LAPSSLGAGFLAFEATVGMYFPAMGTMKSMVVPEAQRSAIYNIYRIPLNVIVLGVLLTKMEMTTAFGCCAVMLGAASYCQVQLTQIMEEEEKEKSGSGGGGDEELGELLE